MSNTGLDSFDQTVQQTNLILKEIETYFGWQDRRDQTYQLLRAVLHTLRDRLPPNLAIHFASQLPLLLKGVFIDGWDPDNVPMKMSREEFLERVREQFPYDTETDTSELVKVVLNALALNMDAGELQHTKEALPEDLQELFTPRV